MRKQLLLAFLCGMVIPLALMGLCQPVKPPASGPDRESGGLSAETEPNRLDDQIRVTVLTDSGNLRQMRLGEYLTGVVLAEMPAEFEMEALKAQAVVARTYTRKRMEHAKHGSAAVCTNSSCCQGYQDPEGYVNNGGRESDVEKIRGSVEQSDGQVLVYDGKLIDATYFSCSGGMTEDAVAVWGTDVPYLQSVESPGEEAAPRYSDRICFTPDNFRLLTGCSGAGPAGTWFGGVCYTDGGGVERIEICGEVFSGTELRAALGLRSTMFSITVEDGMVVVTTRGYGHRVGMSQYGAQAMALSGSGFREILEHYYVGALLEEASP